MIHMKLYGVGNAILHFREKSNLSQLQVCGGICSTTSLCRIETGERNFDSMISETLLGRLGKTANQFEFVLDEEDYHLYETRKKIEDSLKSNLLKEAANYMDKYEQIMPQNQILHDQFLKFHRTQLLKKKGADEETIIKGYLEAIQMTRPDFNKKTKKMMLFSPIEVSIIYELFLYDKLNENDLFSLFRFINNFYDKYEKEDIMIPFLIKLVYQYEKEEKYRDVIRISEEAIDIISSGRKYTHMADFYFLKINAQYKLYYLTEEWQQLRKNMIEICNSLYYMYMIEEENEKMEKVITFCGEKLKCQITK